MDLACAMFDDLFRITPETRIVISKEFLELMRLNWEALTRPTIPRIIAQKEFGAWLVEWKGQ